MRKVLVIGMYDNAMYHPLTGIDEAFRKMFPELELTITDQIMALCAADQYDGIVSYWDDWKEPVPNQAAEALYHYVEKGGSLLVLHNGISLQLQEPLQKMIGGKFVTHPQQEIIHFLVKEHEITKDCEEFALQEEPYQFELEEDQKEIFLMYLYRGKEYPAGWRKGFGKGRVVYLMPGHTVEKFTCEEYIRLVRNCMDWLL